MQEPATREPAAGPQAWEERLRRVLSWVSVVAVVLYGVLLFSLLLIGGAADPQMTALVYKHYTTVVGLPSAAAAALFIVLVLKAAAGPIEFEALGVKFRGASGPIVLWILCFLAIVVAIRTVWGLTYERDEPQRTAGPAAIEVTTPGRSSRSVANVASVASAASVAKKAAPSAWPPASPAWPQEGRTAAFPQRGPTAIEVGWPPWPA